jgi:hypothetical protein
LHTIEAIKRSLAGKKVDDPVKEPEKLEDRKNR